MFTRREALAATGAAVAASTAGCLDVIPFLGNSPIEFAASRATVPGSARSDTGYEERRVRETGIERTFEAGGQSQDVVVRNWQAEYQKAVDLSEAGLPTDEPVQAAVFTVLSTPKVTVLDRSFNPVANLDSRELAETVQDRYDPIFRTPQSEGDQFSLG